MTTPRVPPRDHRLGYLVSAEVATQAGWLYPLAPVGLVGGLSWRRHSPRTDSVRAALVMWGLWFAPHAVAFSLGRVAHSFYVEAIAPAVAALAAAGVVLGWRAWRAGRRSGWLLPAGLVATVAWTVWLQNRFPSFLPWVAPAALGLGVVGLVALFFTRSGRTPPRAVAGVAVGARSRRPCCSHRERGRLPRWWPASAGRTSARPQVRCSRWVEAAEAAAQHRSGRHRPA